MFVRFGCYFLFLCEDKIELPIREFIRNGLQGHAQLDVLLKNIAGNPPENLVIAVIHHRDAVRQILLETHRSELQFAVSYQLSRALDFEPLHIV